MKHVLRVINVLATVVILVAFVVLLRTVFTPAGEIPTIMGYGFMRTLTGSMEPAIPRAFVYRRRYRQQPGLPGRRHHHLPFVR